MGRGCGWLTAETARRYHGWVGAQEYAGFGNDRRRWDVHGVFVPELQFDIDAEARRLRAIMDEIGCVNLFVSEGAGVETIVAELTARGEEPQRDAFGHVKLDTINPGAWFGKQFAQRLGAEKTQGGERGFVAPSAAAKGEAPPPPPPRPGLPRRCRAGGGERRRGRGRGAGRRTAR